jgi:hypothetical protein
MTDITRCSFCQKRRAVADHYLCRKCIAEVPADKVFVPDTARQPGEPLQDFVVRMRTEAHRGQRRMAVKAAVRFNMGNFKRRSS